jgi:hypothetical protein
LAPVLECRNSSTSQTDFPLAASNANARNEVCPSTCVAPVIKILPPETTGEDQPSGDSTFQATFSVALHRTGTFLAWEMPCRSGPRNSGHSAAEANALAEKRHNRTAVEKRFIAVENGQLRVPGQCGLMDEFMCAGRFNCPRYR